LILCNEITPGSYHCSSHTPPTKWLPVPSRSSSTILATIAPNLLPDGRPLQKYSPYAGPVSRNGSRDQCRGYASRSEETNRSIRLFVPYISLSISQFTEMNHITSG